MFNIIKQKNIMRRRNVNPCVIIYYWEFDECTHTIILKQIESHLTHYAYRSK